MMRKLIRSLFMIAVIVFIVYFFRQKIQPKKNIEITKTTVSIITQLKNIQKLETANMTITKLIKAEENLNDLVPGIGLDNMIQDLLFKDKISLEIEGIVVAGFDMDKLETGYINIDKNGELYIKLPPAEILNISLTENTKPFDRQLGLFTKGNIEMETKIRNEAKNMIKSDAIKAGILQTAEQNAKKTLTNLFESAGIIVKEVTIEKQID